MPTTSAHKVFTSLAKLERWLGWAVILILFLQIALLARHTFSWRYGEDVGFFYYFSWLVNERNYLPYRDLHETSFPGSFLIYALITRLSGYSVDAYNFTHIFLFTALSTGSFLMLRRIDTRFAIAATFMFGSSYFFMHRSMHMQRDFLVLLFVIFAIAAMTSRHKLTWKAACSGCLFGIASAIKPHAALAAPIVIIMGTMMQHDRFPLRECLRASGISFAAFLGIWAAILLPMMANGSWTYFYNMLSEYMPLYQKMNGIHLAISPEQRWQNGLDWFSGQFFLNAIPVMLGAVFIWKNEIITADKKWHILMLLALWPVYLIYVTLGGKFWDYHQIPALYFFSIMICLCFIPFTVNSWLMFSWRVVFIGISAIFILQRLSPDYTLAATCLTEKIICNSEENAAYQEEDALELFLHNHLRAGEKVEPLATSTLGPLFPAMLRAKVEPTTPYIEGFPLYHDANSLYVQRIRKDMLEKMTAKPPRFIILPVNFFAPGGSTASAFKELDAFIAMHYEQVTDKKYPDISNIHSTKILERKQ